MWFGLGIVGLVIWIAIAFWPAGAPNVLVILIDDLGFGASSAFGGPCGAPNAERLAAGGLKFTRFHATALCAPTRARNNDHY